jgi:flagellar basal body-associated protein FliL
MKNIMLLVCIGLVASAAGAALPLVLKMTSMGKGAHTDEDGSGHGFEPVFIPYGDVVVNPNDSEQRFLRVRFSLVVAASQEKVVNEAMEKQRPYLRNWLITYLSDKPLKELKGAGAENRCRREIQDRFNNLLFPDGSERIREVLWEEFNFQ